MKGIVNLHVLKKNVSNWLALVFHLCFPIQDISAFTLICATHNDGNKMNIHITQTFFNWNTMGILDISMSQWNHIICMVEPFIAYTYVLVQI